MSVLEVDDAPPPAYLVVAGGPAWLAGWLDNEYSNAILVIVPSIFFDGDTT